MKYKESKTETLKGIQYCVYCGERAQSDLEYFDFHDTRYHYFCDCEDACKEIEIRQKCSELMEEMETAKKIAAEPYYKKIRELQLHIPPQKFSVQTKLLKIEKS